MQYFIKTKCKEKSHGSPKTNSYRELRLSFCHKKCRSVKVGTKGTYFYVMLVLENDVD
jgi:hypothetical protein